MGGHIKRKAADRSSVTIVQFMETNYTEREKSKETENDAYIRLSNESQNMIWYT